MPFVGSLIAKVLTMKTLGTGALYVTRFTLEGAIFRKFKKIIKIFSDLSYLGVIFLFFNLVQESPPSSINVKMNSILTACPQTTKLGLILVVLVSFFVFWVLSIYLTMVYEDDKKWALVKNANLKRNIYGFFACSIGFFLFGIAVTTQ